MPQFICPVCGQELTKSEKAYRCENGHSFDIAKEGYVNLLMSSGKGKRHGDDKLMVRARADFLGKGYYDAFSDAVSDIVLRYAPDDAVILDAGCGECKYTADILHKLSMSGKNADIAGVDISKDAVAIGAKRREKISLAVASVGSLPFRDGIADIIVNLFAPFSGAEFSRVLKDGGKVVRAYPLRLHLWELKQLVYDTPRENEETDMAEAGFTIIETRTVRYKIHLAGSDILSLFRMTPYYYKTGAEDQKKAENADSLDVTLEFGISIYEKD